MKSGKYAVIGSEWQFAVTDFKCSQTAARRCLKPAKFSNGCPAARWIWNFNTKAEARDFVARCNSALAFASGRLGRWITPTFVVVKAKELNTR